MDTILVKSVTLLLYLESRIIFPFVPHDRERHDIHLTELSGNREGKYFSVMEQTGISGSGRFGHLLFFFTLPFLLGSFCIERNNPWDPINGCNSDIEIPEFQSEYTTKIDSISVKLDEYAIVLDSIDSAFSVTRTLNELISQQNDSIKHIIDSLLEHNRIIRDNFNYDSCLTTEECDSIFEQLSDKQTFSSTRAYKTLESLSLDSSAVVDAIAATKLLCDGKEILSEDYVKSKLALYTLQSDVWHALIDSIGKNNTAIENYNASISVFMTDTVNRENNTVNSFNEKLIICRHDRQKDPDVILIKIDSLQPGDSIVFDTGSVTFTDDVKFYGKGDSEHSIYIIGDPDNRTTIHATTYFGIDSSSNIIFKNLIFSETGKDKEIDKRNGVRIINGSNTITFINCIFEKNDLYGIHCENSGTEGDITIKDCIIRYNGDSDSASIENIGGMRFFACGQIFIDNILVVNNTGHGIDVDQTPIKLQRATICDNDQDGIHHFGENFQGDLRCYTSIIAFNGKYGIYQKPIGGVHTAWIDKSNRFFNNPEGHFIGSAIDIAENEIIEVDPQFTDRQNGDYHSPLNNQGIGYQY